MVSELTRVKGKGAEKEGKKLLFVECLLCARQKFSTSVIPFNPHNSLEMVAL